MLHLPCFAMSSKFVSGSFTSSSRPARELETPLIFSKDYKLVTNWYKLHASKCSTAIRKMQLRKEHVAPFHEFIMVLTQTGHTYRVDRGTDSSDGPVWNVLSEQGVPPRDTIALLWLASWRELDHTSSCTIELRWGDDKTIDLKLVLDICFVIHNNSGKRYRLLTHNCYFFAQTIIFTVVRKTVAFGAKLKNALNTALECSITWELLEGEAQQVWDAGKVLKVALVLDTGRRRRMRLEQQLGHRLGHRLGEELVQQLGQWLGEAVGQQLGEALGKRLGETLGKRLGEEVEEQRLKLRKLRLRQCYSVWEAKAWEPQVQQVPVRKGWVSIKHKNRWWHWWRLKREEHEPEQIQEHAREERQKLERGLQTLQPEWKSLLAQARTLVKGMLFKVLVLVMSGELDPNWHEKWSKSGSPVANSSASEFTTMWYVKQKKPSYCYPI